jgi:hypothetical protein
LFLLYILAKKDSKFGKKGHQLKVIV